MVKQYFSRKYFIGSGVVLWTVFYLGRVYGHHGTGSLAAAIEFLGMNWMAVLFLLFTTLLVLDVVTGFGLLLKQYVPSLRGWALPAAKHCR